MKAQELVDAAAGLVPAPGGRVLLGIAGAPGAGKSTLARLLVAELCDRLGPEAAAYVPMDGFHLSNIQLERLGLTNRKGSAPSFDVWGYLALLRRLRSHPATEPVYVPDYDRALHEPIAARHLVTPATRLVVTEGNYLAAGDAAGPGWAQVRAALDIVWFLATPDEVRDTRLIARQREGGRDAHAARAWVDTNDHPNGDLVNAHRAPDVRVITVEP
ncbi:nucleoside/nucleotide kinase family protein [Streptacidiphilus fuscans]|uniref:Nucleoside/nucleotide kinase family protein n=1 Tax=Streptacidiphilus fuscans TaxID=2789292 RepID=A0A931FG57_9ACTN|nr:nucleoside/nucleotide kinase family protein [Streptacidiphilus fuscans]MBF9070551.1 nucleoside/nucleotide kinase family protein [Streptacidiphilus fuscans]